jgi:hypothetical protein
MSKRRVRWTLSWSKVFGKYLGLIAVILIGIFLFAIFQTGLYCLMMVFSYLSHRKPSMLKLGQLCAGPAILTKDLEFRSSLCLSLPYYITAVLSYIVGSIWSVKSLFIVSYLLGGVGMYQLFIKRTAHSHYALFDHLMTLSILNIFVRGAIGGPRLGLIPWVSLVSRSMGSKANIIKWYHPVPLLSFFFHTISWDFIWRLSLGYILTQNYPQDLHD